MTTMLPPTNCEYVNCTCVRYVHVCVYWHACLYIGHACSYILTCRYWTYMQFAYSQFLCGSIHGI